MKSTIFWVTGAAFFAAQAGTLLAALRGRRRAATGSAEQRRRAAEVVWTLVPASLMVALSLMAAGLIAVPGGR